MASESAATLDLKAIRARCGKAHSSLRRLVAQAQYIVDPMADGGVPVAQSLADIPHLEAEVDRLNRAITRVLVLLAPETAMAVNNGYDGTRLFAERDIREALTDE